MKWKKKKNTIEKKQRDSVVKWRGEVGRSMIAVLGEAIFSTGQCALCRGQY